MQPLVFWVEMGGRLGGEMPNNRAFGPRNVMNNRGVVRTRIRSGISLIVSATVLVQKEGKERGCRVFLMGSAVIYGSLMQPCFSCRLFDCSCCRHFSFFGCRFSSFICGSFGCSCRPRHLCFLVQ